VATWAVSHSLHELHQGFLSTCGTFRVHVDVRLTSVTICATAAANNPPTAMERRCVSQKDKPSQLDS
jgi:ribosomal protein L40E